MAEGELEKEKRVEGEWAGGGKERRKGTRTAEQENLPVKRDFKDSCYVLTQLFILTVAKNSCH